MRVEKEMNIRLRAGEGRLSYGLSMILPCPSIVEMAKLYGYDFIRIDCEHAQLNPSEIRILLATARLLGMPCQVRTMDLAGLTALMGQEPSGIMIPHVDSKELAEKVVDLCKFAPIGLRGMDGSTRHMRCGGMRRFEYMEYANRNTDVIVQIESLEGIERIDEILSVKGIDMVATGRADLSQELGVPGQKNHSSVIEVEERIIRKTLEHGKIPVIAADSAKRVDELKVLGVRCIIIGKDETLLASALKKNLAQFKE